MSSAYQYGVETAAQPAAIANVSAPEAICSRLRVRRDEDVRRGEQIGQLVDGEEAIVELDVVAQAEVDDAALEHEAVLLALAAGDLRMGAARDQVQHLGMALDDRGSASITVSRPLPGEIRPKVESRKRDCMCSYPPGTGATYCGRRPAACSRAAGSELDRRAVRHDPDLVVAAGAELSRAAAARSRSSRSPARPRRRAR